MIYKKKSLENERGGLGLCLLIAINLFMVLYPSFVKAQNSKADKTKADTIITFKTKDGTVAISQVHSSLLAGDVSHIPQRGIHSIFAYLKENIHYSPKAIENKKQGGIIVDFTMTKEGQIVNSRIINGLCPDLDKEVLRALKEMPGWESKRDENYKIIVNFISPDGTSTLVPKVSVIGVETKDRMFSVKSTDSKNYDPMIIREGPEVKGDSTDRKIISITTGNSGSDIIDINEIVE